MRDNQSRTAFRSVDEWKAALMTLPDSSFFELLRSVFGNIKTPFNKQRLMEDLFIFLSRSETRKTITAYINGQDHKLIAATALLGEPAPGGLEDFFAGEMTCADLHALILNLEERLILYRFRDDGVMRLALNPVLESVLAPFVADTRLLFPCYGAGKNNQPEKPQNGKEPRSRVCISDVRTFAALFVFIFAEEDFFRAEGVLRKKILDEGKKFFPTLDLELAARTLVRLGLFRTEANRLIPCGERIADFSNLDSSERLDYWAAAVYICLAEAAENSNIVSHNEGFSEGSVLGAVSPGEYPRGESTREEISTADSSSFPPVKSVPLRDSGYFLSRNRLREIADFIHRFRILIDPEKRYPEITLRRFMKLVAREGGAENIWPADNKAQVPFAPFLTVLEMTGLMERTITGERGETFRSLPETAPKTQAASVTQACPAQNASDAEAAPAAKPVIAMDTAFSFVLYPEISATDALALGMFCSLRDLASYKWSDETAVCFELTCESAVRGFDQGIRAADMMELLNRLSLNRIDPNLDWTLKEWESRYAGVSLHQGIVLCLAEDRRYLAEAEPLVSLIRRVLAPGVYLLSSGERSGAAKALRKAGVDIVAQPPLDPRAGFRALCSEANFKTGSRRYGSTGLSRNSFPRLESAPGFVPVETSSVTGDRGTESPDSPPEENQPRTGKEEGNSADSIKEKFRRVLETMRLTKTERDELAARIERRLVLSEAQLEGTSLRYEKLEARGLDYSGKSVIAKQAVTSGSLLEVTWPGAGGTLNRIVGKASALEKKEGDSILVLKTYPGKEALASSPADAMAGASQVSADAAFSEIDPALENTIHIPLGKISLLRRIKQSIFGE